MTVAIIDYGSGNLRSAARALERAAAAASDTIVVTADARAVARADRIVLPGVGAFADCRRGLEAVPGMIDALQDAVMDRGRPFLGICVGMQLMAERGREHGDTAGLGWLAADVVPIAPQGEASPGGIGFRVPHMGWNELELHETHPVLKDLPPDGHAYFVHSYHMQCRTPRDVYATVEYGQTVTAVVGRDNMIGTQFHPEKSQALGLKLLANFLSWSP